MAESNQNLWAPWRMEYIRSIDDDDADGCFLCRYWENPDDDRRNHVLWRGKSVFVVMNRFPYTNGHLLIAPAEHTADFGGLNDPIAAELATATRDAVRLLGEAIGPHGYNIGTNLERCAGAGLPGHLHTHIVPRWNGDTNFMAVVGDIRVIPQSLDALYDELVTAAGKLKPGADK